MVNSTLQIYPHWSVLRKHMTSAEPIGILPYESAYGYWTRKTLSSLRSQPHLEMLIAMSFMPFHPISVKSHEEDPLRTQIDPEWRGRVRVRETHSSKESSKGAFGSLR